MTTKEEINNITEKIDLIEPSTGKLFFEHKTELVFCKPHLMPLKSQALERLEEMQRDTARQLQEKRKIAAAAAATTQQQQQQN